MLFNTNLTLLGLTLLAIANSALAIGPSAVNLRTAGTFAVLSKSGVSTVPPSAITGNIGVSPISSGGLTGFSLTLDKSGTFSTSKQVTGKVYAASYTSPTPSQLTTTILDMQTAFTDATGRVNPNFLNLLGGGLAGLVLAPGLYTWGTSVNAATSFSISGSSTDTWIFQVAGTLIFSPGARVILSGGAQASNIVWVVSGAVTLGVGSHLEGVVLGKKSITLTTGTTVNGRILAQTNVALQVATIVS
ncbi:ice-binding protein [Gymnopilus junonius]|uniref:Ice-binding protein n=1 Tax=Gymnopilus junonius TaxID=109634 RepID=A0A9P5NMQ9_GYMJU|nr:ice-binding protein [Gymnopilus junonius]